MKKHLKWIIPVVVILAALIVAAVLLWPEAQQAPVQQPAAAPEITMAWNVDREDYVDDEGNSFRKRSGDYYRLRFAVDGGQRELLFADESLARQADSMDIMGLEIGEDGIVTNVLSVDDFTGGTGPQNYCVTDVTENTVTCCVVMSGQGPSITYTYDEDTKIYNIGDKSVLCGVPGTLQRGCRIWAVLRSDGTVHHAYISSPFERQPVYWNMARKYDSTTKQTTRESDAIGYYTYDFAVNGEQVQLKTRDFTVACKIDSIAARCMALTFDEEGYIVGASGANVATGNASLASWHHVTELTDEGFTAYKFANGADKGNTAVGTFSDDCKVYDVSARAEYVGAETELRLHDQVHCLRDSFGDVCMIFVINRFEEADIYWNAERKYENGASTRTPDKDGWYYLRMASGGSLRTYKTKDKAIVDYIDSRAAKNVAMRLEGDVITEAFSTGFTFTGQTFCSWAVVTDISDEGEITAVKDGKTVFKGFMTEDCRAFNVSPTAGYVGTETTLYEGDKIHALMSLDGKINTVFIVERPIYSPIYWNVSKKYDAANKVTARTPDEKGYYHITFAVDGEQKTFKTNKKDIATKVDQIATNTMGLWVYNGIIVDVYAYTKLEGYTGSIGGWYTVTDIEGTTVTIEDRRPTSQTPGTVYTVEIPENTPVYNVSNDYEVQVGEPTEIRLGDQVFTLVNGKKTAHVFVVSRTYTALCTHCNKQVSWKAWDGKTQIEDGGHYYLKSDLTQTAQLRINKDCTGCLDLNGQTLTVAPSAGRAFNLYGTLNLMGEGMVVSVNDSVNMATVAYIQNGGTFNMYGGTLTAQYAAPRAGIVMVQGIFNMYGGTIKNGQATGNGGNLEILASGVFTMYDGTISGGNAANGGSIYSNGTIQILGGTVENGTAKEGGNIYMKKGTLEMSGGTLSGGTASGSGGNIKYDAEAANEGTVTVGGTARVENGTAGGKGGNMYIRWTGKLSLKDEAVVTGGRAATGGGIVCYVCKPTVSGNVQVTGNEVSDLYLDGNATSVATVLLDNLGADARIGIYMLRPGAFVSGVTEDVLSCFFSNHDDYGVVYEDDKLLLKEN